MENNSNSGRIYTLAESGTNKVGQNEVLLAGTGSDLNNNKAMVGRAKRKLISQSLSLQLIDLANQTGDSHKVKGYWNTYHSQNSIISAEGRVYGRYCKNRFCPICCSIRKADLINRYLPIIEQWEDPYFVTITIKACKEDKLKSRVNGILRGFRKIKERHKKNNQRGKGMKLMGVKSLECNFNPEKKTYNPHLHLIVPDKRTAEVIIDTWLKIATPAFAIRRAQDMRKVYDLEKGLIEIIKYSSKIFTEPDAKKVPSMIYLAALDNILSVMKGKRVFERFGFNAEKKEKPVKVQKAVQEYQQWEYNPKATDWQNKATEEPLTGYKPHAQLMGILTNNIDLASQ